MKGEKTITSNKQNTLSVSGSALSIESLQIIIVMGFYFFPHPYCHLIITDEIIDSGSFNRLHSH